LYEQQVLGSHKAMHNLKIKVANPFFTNLVHFTLNFGTSDVSGIRTRIVSVKDEHPYQWSTTAALS